VYIVASKEEKSQGPRYYITFAEMTKEEATVVREMFSAMRPNVVRVLLMPEYMTVVKLLRADPFIDKEIHRPFVNKEDEPHKERMSTTSDDDPVDQEV
jgi:hypothetical protein